MGGDAVTRRPGDAVTRRTGDVVTRRFGTDLPCPDTENRSQTVRWAAHEVTGPRWDWHTWQSALSSANQLRDGEVVVPTYEYSCTECAERLEVQQSFTDDALTQCPACGGRLRKLFNAVGVVFKGAGFYRTDSRAAANGDGDAKSGEPTPAKTAAGEGSANGAAAAAGNGKPATEKAPAPVTDRAEPAKAAKGAKKAGTSA